MLHHKAIFNKYQETDIFNTNSDEKDIKFNKKSSQTLLNYS